MNIQKPLNTLLVSAWRVWAFFEPPPERDLDQTWEGLICERKFCWRPMMYETLCSYHLEAHYRRDQS